jgi:hypothetical protein
MSNSDKSKVDEIIKTSGAVPPVDRSQRATALGKYDPNDPEHRKTVPGGQQKDYVILTDEERSRGFVRPVRRTYIHLKCNTETRMGQQIAETYARDPEFYSGTFCVACGAHFPVGPDGEFVWKDDETQKVGT